MYLTSSNQLKPSAAGTQTHIKFYLSHAQNIASVRITTDFSHETKKINRNLVDDSHEGKNFLGKKDMKD